MSQIHWVVWGTGSPKDRDEVKRREVWECEGWVCDLEAIGAPSMFRLIRRAASLARVCPTLETDCLLAEEEENKNPKKNHNSFFLFFTKALLPGWSWRERREWAGGALSACLCTSQDDDTSALSLTIPPLLSNQTVSESCILRLKTTVWRCFIAPRQRGGQQKVRFKRRRLFIPSPLFMWTGRFWV